MISYVGHIFQNVMLNFQAFHKLYCSKMTLLLCFILEKCNGSYFILAIDLVCEFDFGKGWITSHTYNEASKWPVFEPICMLYVWCPLCFTFFPISLKLSSVMANLALCLISLVLVFIVLIFCKWFFALWFVHFILRP